MNKVILMGRLTRDPDIRYSNNGQNNLCIARYTLAVDRRGREAGKQTLIISAACPWVKMQR